MSLADREPWQRVEAMKRSYLRVVSFPTRISALATLVLSVFVSLLWARGGTLILRTGAAIFLFSSGSLLLLWAARRQRRLRQPEKILKASLAGFESDLAERAVRALKTWARLQESDAPAESPELARLHLDRVLRPITKEKIRDSLRETRRRRYWGALVLSTAAVSLLLTRAFALLEGAGVLCAQQGVAPFAVSYITQIDVAAEWPSYLDGTGKKRGVSPSLAAVPQGSEIEVRVTPLVTDRDLILTDGVTEVPLLSDGKGGLVARWLAEDPSGLRVAARFGDVLVYDSHQTQVAPLHDRAPVVELLDAPQELKLEELESLELSFSAMDDHGLTQVDLVLRSGQRESRTELASLDGRALTYRGGHRLTREHELLRRAFLPVRVTIEARDNNVATGPSWGESQPYLLLPPPVGEEVAARHVALRAFREQVATFLAKDLESEHLGLVQSTRMKEQAYAQLKGAFSELQATLRIQEKVPKSSLSFMEAQLEALDKNGSERASPEAVLLGIDAMMHAVAFREAQALSKDLGSAVDEIAVLSRELRFQGEGVRLEGVFDLLRGVEVGASMLREVGNLGADLGSVARGDLARIRRSLKEKEYRRAEVGAVHLAARLKRANASFSSVGGAGVESGSPSGGKGASGGASGPASESPDQFQDMAGQLEELAMDQASEVSELERILEEARRAAEADFDAGDGTEDATEKLRDALADLPASGSAPGTFRSEAASARSQGEAMADSLDNGDLLEGLQRGLDAAEALRRAKRLAEQGPSWFQAEDLDATSQALEEALKLTQEAAERLKQHAEAATQKSLGDRATGQSELAKRARELARSSKGSEAPLPGENLQALDRAARLLDQAAQALRAGQGERGASFADEAREQLERAVPESDVESAGSPSDSAHGGQGRGQRARGHVPGENKDQARDFRRRVEKGLGRGSGRLAPAVRRYAERLK